MNVPFCILLMVLTPAGAGGCVFLRHMQQFSDTMLLLIVLTVIPINTTQPSGPLLTFSSLTCEIQADFPLSFIAVESRWTFPNGTIISMINNRARGRYFVSQGPSINEYLTIFLIDLTIYSDANTYTCEVRDIRDFDNRGPWLPAQTTLQLLGKHLIIYYTCALIDHAVHSGVNC